MKHLVYVFPRVSSCTYTDWHLPTYLPVYIGSTIAAMVHGLTPTHSRMNVDIYPVTMVSVAYHCGLSVIYPQFELAVRHLGINHYCSLSLMSNPFSCLPISHT